MSRRIERLNVLLRQEISRIVAREVNDPRLRAMVSVTRVETSPDLQFARAYVSVYGGPEEREQAMRGLRSATGYIRRQLGPVLALRTLPTLSFVMDESIERGAELLKTISEIAALRPEREAEGEMS